MVKEKKVRTQVSTGGLIWEDEVLLAERRMPAGGQIGVKGAQLRLGCDELHLEEMPRIHWRGHSESSEGAVGAGELGIISMQVLVGGHGPEGVHKGA